MTNIEVLFYPLIKLFEILFLFNYSITHSYGLSIILLSLEFTILLIPLYRLASIWQGYENNIQQKMSLDLAGINHRYKGSKKDYLMMRTYKIHHYNPIYSLRSSLALLIQIPFFFSAYLFLSHNHNLQGISFLFINDLGKEDNILNGVNLLPLIMTLFNVISGIIYNLSKENKNSKQIFILAILFLVLLYKSPAGLVLYWTMNNLFSLIKYYLEVKPRSKDLFRLLSSDKLYRVLSLYSLLLLIFLSVLKYIIERSVWSILLNYSNYLIAVHYIVMIVLLIKGKVKNRLDKLLYLSQILLLLFVGLIFYHYFSPILHNYLQEGALRPFNNTEYGRILKAELLIIVSLLILFHRKSVITVLKIKIDKPLSYLLLSIFFVLSLLLLYLPLLSYGGLLGEKGIELVKVYQPNIIIFVALFSVVLLLSMLLRKLKRVMTLLTYMSLSLLVIVVVNVYVRKLDLGHFDKMIFSQPDVLEEKLGLQVLDYSILFFIMLLVLNVLINIKRYRVLLMLLLLNVVVVSMTIFMFVSLLLTKEYRVKVDKRSSLESFIPAGSDRAFSFSSRGKNIIVLFADMLNGGVVKRILDEEPSLREKFEGFVYYPNTLSISGVTQSSIGAMTGGWGYTVGEMNDRGEIISKQIASAYDHLSEKLLSKGYDVVYSDPQLLDERSSKYSNDDRVLYHDNKFANYYRLEENTLSNNIVGKLDEEVKGDVNNEWSKTLIFLSLFRALPFSLKSIFYDDGYWHGLLSNEQMVNNHVIEEWSSLQGLLDFSHVVDDNKNRFKYYQTALTHYPYGINKELKIVGNSVYEKPYYSAKKTLLLATEWLEKLKAQNIYDNSKIIIVSDHGTNSYDDHSLPKNFPYHYFKGLHAALLVKDFSSSGEFKEDNKFMSNADVPAIIWSGVTTEDNFSPLDIDPTIYDLSNRELDAWIVQTLDGFTIHKEKSLFVQSHYRVKNSIFINENWQKIK